MFEEYRYITPGKNTAPPTEVYCRRPEIRDWILSCRPACACIFESSRGSWFCQNVYCKKHGQKQRIDRKERVLAWGIPCDPAAAVVLKFDAFVSFSDIGKARGRFLTLLKRHRPDLAYFWTVEWVDFIPHINMTILRFMDDLVGQVKECWNTALKEIGIPDPEARRTYCLPVRNYTKWVNYVFKSKQVLPARLCRPVMAQCRCPFWNFSKSYSVQVATSSSPLTAGSEGAV